MPLSPIHTHIYIGMAEAAMQSVNLPIRRDAARPIHNLSVLVHPHTHSQEHLKEHAIEPPTSWLVDDLLHLYLLMEKLISSRTEKILKEPKLLPLKF